MKKQERLLSSELNKFNLDDDYEYKILPFISKYGRYFLYVIAALILSMIIFFKWSSSQSVTSEIDFMEAETAYKKFKQAVIQQNSSLTEESLFTLNQFLFKHPSLQSKYDAPIAEALIIEDNPQQAKLFVERTLMRTKSNDLHNYTHFAKATLLISEKKYQDALKLAQTLHQSMLDEATKAKTDLNQQSFEDVLFGFNLLRIAMLQQEMGQSNDERQTWNEFLQYAELADGSSTIKNSTAAKMVMDHFNEGNVTFLSYIKMRQEYLKIR